MKQDILKAELPYFVQLVKDSLQWRIKRLRRMLHDFRQVHRYAKEYDGRPWSEVIDLCAEINRVCRSDPYIGRRKPRLIIAFFLPFWAITSKHVLDDEIRLVLYKKRDRIRIQQLKRFRWKVRKLRALLESDRFWVQDENAEKLGILLQLCVHLGYTCGAAMSGSTRRFVLRIVNKPQSKEAEEPATFGRMYLYLFRELMRNGKLDLIHELQKYPQILQERQALIKELIDVSIRDHNGKLIAVDLREVSSELLSKVMYYLPEQVFRTPFETSEHDARKRILWNLKTLQDQVLQDQERIPSIIEPKNNLLHSWGLFLYVVTSFCEHTKWNLRQNVFPAILNGPNAILTLDFCLFKLGCAIASQLKESGYVRIDPFLDMVLSYGLTNIQHASLFTDALFRLALR